jgi:hypothetical protein
MVSVSDGGKIAEAKAI